MRAAYIIYPIIYLLVSFLISIFVRIFYDNHRTKPMQADDLMCLSVFWPAVLPMLLIVQLASLVGNLIIKAHESILRRYINKDNCKHHKKRWTQYALFYENNIAGDLNQYKCTICDHVQEDIDWIYQYRRQPESERPKIKDCTKVEIPK